MTTRRDLLVALGAAAFAAPLGALAQPQNKIWRVGVLRSTSRPASLDSDPIGGFPKGMRELGYIEGKNLVIEWRFADNKPDRLSDMAAELVQLNVDILVTAATPAAISAQKATTTIPIIMVGVADPVRSGLIKSLARPGGNITGLSNLVNDTGPKRLELLLEMVPKLARVAVLVNPANPSARLYWGSENITQAAAQKRRVELLLVEVRTPQEIDSAFSLIRKQNAGALLVSTDALFTQQMSQIAELAAKNRLPSVYAFPEYAQAGGLISYGPPYRPIPARRDLCRQDSEGRETCRSAGRAANETRIGDQPQDSQSSRSRHSAVASDKRGQGDRVSAPGDRQGVKGESPRQ